MLFHRVRDLQPEELLSPERGRKMTLARYTENDEPHPQVDTAFGFLIVNPPPVTVSAKSTSAALR